MNRAERRVRDLINPYSTAFAIWWCHSAGPGAQRRRLIITKDYSAAHCAKSVL
jgi:hypothetical protein